MFVSFYTNFIYANWIRALSKRYIPGGDEMDLVPFLFKFIVKWQMKSECSQCWMNKRHKATSHWVSRPAPSSRTGAWAPFSVFPIALCVIFPGVYCLYLLCCVIPGKSHLNKYSSFLLKVALLEYTLLIVYSLISCTNDIKIMLEYVFLYNSSLVSQCLPGTTSKMFVEGPGVVA